jgi:hypothetical protein
MRCGTLLVANPIRYGYGRLTISKLSAHLVVTDNLKECGDGGAITVVDISLAAGWDVG